MQLKVASAKAYTLVLTVNAAADLITTVAAGAQAAP